MKHYTPWQYLCIDVANYFGHDKLLFEDRIAWVEDNFDQLEDRADEADKKPLYLKSVQALRKAQRGEPSGHLVAFDAVCSGMQIMSALTGCVNGAHATGLVNPNKRADAYSVVTQTMQGILGNALSVSRQHAKDATMKVLYGSRAEPKKIFGEGTPELQAFYKALFQVAPGACELLQALLNSWQPYALEHAWVLPDGYEARVKVMAMQEARIEVDELDHATFTYQWWENQGEKGGLSNAANVIHSIDAWILRSLVRRCNYNPEQVRDALRVIETELLMRALGADEDAYGIDPEHPIHKYKDRYLATGLADTVILPHLDWNNVRILDTEHLQQLEAILVQMLAYQPFSVVPVHDQFATHANHVHWIRYWYKELLAELADSTILDDIFSQLHGKPCTYQKLSTSLAPTIRQSEYALS